MPAKPLETAMPKGGIEPPRPCGRRILSPVRLPVPPLRLMSPRQGERRRPRPCPRHRNRSAGAPVDRGTAAALPVPETGNFGARRPSLHGPYHACSEYPTRHPGKHRIPGGIKRRPMKTITRRLLPVALAGLVALGVAASAVAAPARHAADTLTFCTDATYPPEEFYQGTKLVGSDIDIGTEIAKRTGLKREVPEHRLRRHHRRPARKEVRRDHQRYERHGRAPKAGRFRRLPLGRAVADGEEGQPQEDLDADQPVREERLGRGRHDQQAVPRRREQATGQEGQAGDQGRHLPEGHGRRERAEDGHGSTATSATRRSSRTTSRRTRPSGSRGAPVNPIAVGIAIRKGDALVAKTRKAVTAMYADGTMKKILAKWQMGGIRLKEVTD